MRLLFHVRYCFDEENEYFQDLGKGKRRRKIYFRVHYEEEEEASIREVRTIMKEEGIFEK